MAKSERGGLVRKVSAGHRVDRAHALVSKAGFWLGAILVKKRVDRAWLDAAIKNIDLAREELTLLLSESKKER